MRIWVIAKSSNVFLVIALILISWHTGSYDYEPSFTTSNGRINLIVLVFEDVAVPDVAAGLSLEWNDDARDHGGIGADGVFPSHLFRRGRTGGCG